MCANLGPRFVKTWSDDKITIQLKSKLEKKELQWDCDFVCILKHKTDLKRLHCRDSVEAADHASRLMAQ